MKEEPGRFEDAYVRGRQGELASHSALWAAAPSPWTEALRLQAYLGGVGERPEIHALGGLGSSALASELRRLALLDFDGESLIAADRAMQGSDASVFERRLSEGWRLWCEGSAKPALLESLGRDARAASLAHVTLEAQALRALHHLLEDDVPAAVQAARRASRMARVESYPDLEVLANLVLTRVRRYQGRPQLALRILQALTPHAPPAWRRWICWEALLSGARFRGARDDGSVLGALLRLCDAVEGGELGTVPMLSEALERASQIVPLQQEANWAASLLTLEPSTTPAPCERWRHGDERALPTHLRGFAFADGSDAKDERCAMLVALPGGTAQRVLARSVPLAIAVHGAEGSCAEAPTRPRTDTGLATLAFAKGPMPIHDYFSQVYEYTFDPTVHRAMLNMHVKRMRERVNEAAIVQRDGPRIALQLDRPVIFRDPRCEQSLEDRVLSLLALSGAQSASSLAKLLRVPLRSVQRLLRDLQMDAGVEQTKRGRSVTYAVEDTTFSEPTRTRRFDGSLDG